jgi:flagellar hook-length control protein FliK
MTLPLLSAPTPAAASAPAPSTTGDAGPADSSGADDSFGSVFDAATKNSDKTAEKSPGTGTRDATDDKTGKHSAEADASTAAAATVAGLPMMPQAAAASHTVPARDAVAGNGAASVTAIANATRSSGSVKIPVTAAATAADSAATADSGAASATAATATARSALPAAATSKGVFMPQAANASDTDAAHHAHDAKDLAAALTTATSQSGLNASLPSGAALATAGMHGAAQLPQPNAPIAVQHIAAPVGSAPWHDAVAHGLLHVITLHQQHAELHVNPPHMGPIDVHIHVAADQAAVTFTAAHADTRAALEQALPRLRDMLSGQGIFLGQAAVQSDSRPRQGPPQDHRAPRRVAAAGSPAAAQPIRVVHYFSRSDRIVDTFA